MSEETNKRLIERFYKEMWNQWNFELTGELLSDDISFRGSLGAEMRGRTAFCDYMRRVKKSFPDFHNETGEMVAERDRVVAQLTYRGTHDGDIFGLPPTGKRICYTGAAFFHIENNRVAEGWVLGDVFGLLQQLGRNPLLEIRRARTEEANAAISALRQGRSCTIFAVKGCFNSCARRETLKRLVPNFDIPSNAFLQMLRLSGLSW
jgi:steroid delta-isomerase-like uncharacterized protein